MYFIIISWILYEMTNDALYTGALVSVGFIPSLLINLLFGVIVDRFNRRKLTFYASLISAMTVLIIWILILNEWLTPISIILSHMIIQLMGSLFRPAIQALVAEIFDQKNLPRVFSQSGSAAIIGGLLGASCGGLIVGVTSAFTATSIVFTSFLLTSFAVQLIKENSTNDNRNLVKNNIRTDLADGFVYLRNNLFLLELFSVMFVGQLVFHTSIAFLSVYVNEYLEKSVSVYGFLDASISIGGVIAGMLGARWWNLNKRYLSINSLLVIASGLLLVGLSPYLVSVFLGAMLIGLGTTWIRVLLQSVQQIATDKAYHGRMASYRMICNQGSVVISAPILGWVANTYGANMVYVTLLLPVGVAILFSVRQQKNKKFIAITEESV